METSQPTMIVGVGASAGGLNAFGDFLKDISLDSGFGYVLIQHLSPDYDSILPDLLQESTELPVDLAVDGMPVRPDHVYVIPSGSTLEIEDGVLQVDQPEDPGGRNNPIDLFLRSLARDQGPQSAGVILSGTGSDGALGLKAVKEIGGVTIVQDPLDAEYDGMPRAAIATGCVDIVAAAEACGVQLSAFVNAETLPSDQPSPEEADDEEDATHLAAILNLIASSSGLDFEPYKTTTIWRRIQHRCQIRQAPTLPAYIKLLESDSKERKALVRDFLISVTNFFRDPEAFQVVRDTIIPQLAEDCAATDTIRVWVPGCATGEEAYSLLMLFFEHFKQLETPPSIQVFATDVNTDSLATAREGFYPDSITSDVSAERLKRFFVKEEGGFRVRRELKDHVLFTTHNLLQDPPFSNLDFISCRNVLIYLKREAQERVVRLFHYALHERGILFTGRADTPASLPLLFEAVAQSPHLYRARDVDSNHTFPVVPGTKPLPFRPMRRPSSKGESSIEVIHRTAAIERYLPPSLLVDETLKIVHVLGNVENFLRIGSGVPTHLIQETIRPEMRTELRAALFGVFKHNARTVIRHVRLPDGHDDTLINILVEPYEVEDTGEAYALVAFTDSEPIADEAAPDDVDAVDQAVRERLEDEMESTRHRLQVMTEEYETSNEELLTSNEELQSMNEELRSTMEELETSKEELQSTNEELVTVNRELRANIEALNRSNSDIRNLMAATQIATLFLDTSLTVQRFTPQLTRLFNVIPSDKGRPFDHLSHNLQYENLAAIAEQVLDTLTPVKEEVQTTDDRWLKMRVMPYRTIDDRIGGVILTFIDVTDLKEAERRVEETNAKLEDRVEERTAELTEANEALQKEVEERRRAEEHFQRLFRLGPVAGTITALENNTIVDVNDRYLELTGYDRADVIGQSAQEFGLLPSEAISEGTHQILNRETQLRKKDGETVALMVSSEVIDRQGAASVLSLGVDMTAQKATEAMLLKAKDEAEAMSRLKSSFIANMSHEIRTPLTAIIGFSEILCASLEPDVEPFAERILISGERLLDTLNSVLDLAKLDAEEVTLQDETTELVGMAKESLSLFATQAEEKGLTLQADLPDQPIYARLDARCLKRALSNLLSNAVKFTNEGSITLRLALDPDEESPIRFEVEDTGIGISEEFRSDLFREFTQESTGISRSHEGSGLGLTITQRLVQLLGGTIAVDSTSGVGSTFSIRLPHRIVDPPATDGKMTDGQAETPFSAQGTPPAVLLIDDRPEVGTIVERFLNECRVTTVRDPGQVAELLAQTEPCDLVLLDIQLGDDISGIDVLELIHSTPGYIDVPVVALTAHSLPEDRQRFLKQGFDGCITKPFSRDELRAEVRHFMAGGAPAT